MHLAAARTEIILIGPMGVGKTTLALHLSEKLGVLNYPVDRLKWYYRFKNGYDLAKGTRILRTSGFLELNKYFHDYFGTAELAQLLDEFRGGIFDFGASHSHFESKDELHAAMRVLASFRNIIQLLPTADFDTNCQILDERIAKRYEDVEWKREVLDSYFKQNRIFLKSGSYSALARALVYTDGKTIEQVGDEILEKVAALTGRRVLYGV
jgi:deoxyadenosine/deoxycytidine kinase